MMSNTLGAPLGGATRGGQTALESLAERLIVPPKAVGGGGRYLPSMVFVAAGDPIGGPASLAGSSAASTCRGTRSAPVANKYPSSAPAASTTVACNFVFRRMDRSLVN